MKSNAERLADLIVKMRNWIEILEADEIPDWASCERVSKEMRKELGI